MTDQVDIEKFLKEKPHFNGSDYKPKRDDVRLTGQIKRVYSAMSDGEWKTLRVIESITNDPQASISAQLRHLRKERFGSHVIEKRFIANGLYEYRLLPKEDN